MLSHRNINKCKNIETKIDTQQYQHCNRTNIEEKNQTNN